MLRVFLTGLLFSASLGGAASAQTWQPYANSRYDYSIELPPGFALTEEAANGDGITLSTEDGQATLYVFASPMTEGDFTAEITSRMHYADTDDGWNISYKRISKAGASYSGTLAGRVLYVRGVPICDHAIAYFQIEYPEAQTSGYHAVIKHLVDTLRAGESCKP